MLHQDGCNHMKQTVEAGGQVIDQPPRRQDFGLVKSGPFQIATTSRAQQQPRQQRHGNQRKWDTSNRKYTKLNMSMSQVLLHMLNFLNLVTLKDPPRNPNTSSPSYHPNERCTYHSNSPVHDTDSCWTLKFT